MRFECPDCGQKLALETMNAGQAVKCPAYGANITAPVTNPTPSAEVIRALQSNINRRNIALVAMLWVVLTGPNIQADNGQQGFRGQLHTHSYWSDGRGFPEQTNEAKEQGLPSPILVTNTTARLVELTATVNLTNDSSVDVQKYFFRLTTPPGDLPYQRSRLLTPFPEAMLKAHKNGIDNYLELVLAIPANKTVTKEVKFVLLQLPVDYLKVSNLPVTERDKLATQKYLLPSDLIESDATEIKKVSGSLFGANSSELEKARAAYEYPARVLKYHPQKAAGAVNALQTGIGDCTEYSCLFCALCRAGGVPARRVAVFNLGAKNEITDKEPNHDTAEVFLSTHGWVPVDPNVGGGKYDRPVGFARVSNNQIVLKREGSWVWGSSLPSDGVAPNMPKPEIKITVSWHAKVIQEGGAEDLIREFTKGKQ